MELELGDCVHQLAHAIVDDADLWPDTRSEIHAIIDRVERRRQPLALERLEAKAIADVASYKENAPGLVGFAEKRLRYTRHQRLAPKPGLPGPPLKSLVRWGRYLVGTAAGLSLDSETTALAAKTDDLVKAADSYLRMGGL